MLCFQNIAKAALFSNGRLDFIISTKAVFKFEECLPIPSFDIYLFIYWLSKYTDKNTLTNTNK